MSKVKQTEVENWIYFLEILNMAVGPFFTYDNKDCKKKITSTPGSKIYAPFAGADIQGLENLSDKLG